MIHKKPNQGFTLIEVVLVLAVGGLIFLLAFLAFQQVSKNRRDTQRRSDARRMIGYLEEYAANNNGVYPCDTNHAAVVEQYPNTFTGRNHLASTVNSCGMQGTLSSDATFNQPQSGSPYLAYNDPSTGPTQWMIIRTAPGFHTLGRMSIVSGAKCDGLTILSSSNVTDKAVQIMLENGKYYCADNASQ